MNRMLFVALGAALLALGAFGTVYAHASIVSCMPAVGSTVASAPAQVICVFSEEIDTKQSTMSVLDSNGSQVDKKDAHVDLNDPDHKTLIVSLDPAQAKQGLFTVKWHSVTPDDNGISDGSWQFIIGSTSSTPYPPTLVVQGESAAPATPTQALAASTVAPAATTAPGPVATSTPAATVTPAAPTTLPTTGASISNGLILIAMLGAIIVLTGTLIRVRR